MKWKHKRNYGSYYFMPSLPVKDHSNPATNEWRGSDNASTHLESRTERGYFTSVGVNTNNTCFDCQHSFKGTEICPTCRKQLIRLPFTIRVPRKGRKRAWKALETKMADRIKQQKNHE